MYKKATASRIFFFLRAVNTGAGLTGLSPTGVVAKDDGDQAAVAGTFTETGLGQYRFDGTIADFNGDVLGFVFSGTGAIDYDVTVATSPVSYDELTTPTNVSRVSTIIHRA